MNIATLKTIELEEILPLIQKPGRYIGGEHNQIKKDLDKVSVKIALCFPDLYEIGMSHLGLKILYGLLNQYEHIACERVFAVAPDLEQIMRERKIPLFSLESRLPLSEFDLIGFSLQYEMNYTNMLNILELSGIPLRSRERGDNFPLIIAGGPCCVNPEPIADFIDVFLIGEAEEAILEIVETYKQVKSKNEKGKINKNELLVTLAQIQGVYVPSLYEVSYNSDSTIKEFRPKHKEIPSKIKKRIVNNLEKSYFPVKPVVPYISIVHDRISLEVMRGCPHQCRFCQASRVYYPPRQRSQEMLLKLAQQSYTHTGYDEISLLSLSSADYKDIIALVNSLNQAFKEKGVSISLPSLRITNLIGQLPLITSAVKKTGLTFALEAGSQRLRKLMYKDIPLEFFFDCLKNSYNIGYRHIKLYFMIGLPSEEDNDLEEMAELIRKSSHLKKEIDGHLAEISAAISYFIPKPHTAWEREGMADINILEKKEKLLKSKISSAKKVKLKFHDARLSYLEGILCRGDRRLSDVVEAAFKMGAKFDSWYEHFRFDLWQEAFKKCRLEGKFYLRCRSADEILPWEFIDVGTPFKI